MCAVVLVDVGRAGRDCARVVSLVLVSCRCSGCRCGCGRVGVVAAVVIVLIDCGSVRVVAVCASVCVRRCDCGCVWWP